MTVALVFALTVATLAGWPVYVLWDERPIRPRRRQWVTPSAQRRRPGTGVDRGHGRPAVPRSPQDPAGAVVASRCDGAVPHPPGLSMLVDATGRQTAAPTSPQSGWVTFRG